MHFYQPNSPLRVASSDITCIRVGYGNSACMGFRGRGVRASFIAEFGGREDCGGDGSTTNGGGVGSKSIER